MLLAEQRKRVFADLSEALQADVSWLTLTLTLTLTLNPSPSPTPTLPLPLPNPNPNPNQADVSWQLNGDWLQSIPVLQQLLAFL